MMCSLLVSDVTWCASEEGGRERACVGDCKACVTWMCGTGLVQIGVHKSGGAKLYTRVSEMLQWILTSKGVGKHPAQMLNLHITDLGLPDEASVTIYAGHRLVCVHCGGSGTGTGEGGWEMGRGGVGMTMMILTCGVVWVAVVAYVCGCGWVWVGVGVGLGVCIGVAVSRHERGGRLTRAATLETHTLMKGMVRCLWLWKARPSNRSL